MTAHAMAGDDQKSIDAGMNDHVTKPIDPDQLFGALQKWIKPSSERTADQQMPAGEEIPESKQTGPEDDPLPESLPGFDLAAGLARLMGNKRLYRKLLVDFGNNYKGAAGEIREVLDADDYEQAHSLVHNLKGLAGNLEATDLQAAAVELEKQVKDRTEKTVSKTELGQRFSDLQDALFRALEAVGGLSSSEEKQSIEGSTEEMASVFQQLPEEAVDRLKAAVEMGDVMQVQSIANAVKSTNDELTPVCDKLIQLAEDFNFDGLQAFMDDLIHK